MNRDLRVMRMRFEVPYFLSVMRRCQTSAERGGQRENGEIADRLETASCEVYRMPPCVITLI